MFWLKLGGGANCRNEDAGLLALVVLYRILHPSTERGVTLFVGCGMESGFQVAHHTSHITNVVIAYWIDRMCLCGVIL